MPAFGKDGIVNVNANSCKNQWNVIKNGVVVASFDNEKDAKGYVGTLITSGVNQTDVEVKLVSLRCI